ncbi:hypothetical protein ABTM79_19110, partial [Acinetobacter baumannii]
PFGHLNSSWEHFKSYIEADDEIWKFSKFEQHDMIQDEDWGRVISGYAIVRNHVVVQEFYSEYG